MHRGDILAYPMGHIILDSQAYLMDVLVSILDHILEGVDPARPTGDQIWRHAVSNFRPKDEVVPWAPFTNATLGRPLCFDAADTLKFIQAMSERAQDHLWCLQCDKSYLHRQLQIITNSACWDREPVEKKGARFASQMVTTSLDCCSLDCLEQEARILYDIRCKYDNISKNIIAPGNTLPVDYDFALGTFMHYTYFHILQRKDRLRIDMCDSPLFDRWYILDNGNEEAQGRRVRPVRQHNHSAAHETTLVDFGGDFFDWCLCHMSRTAADVHTNFDFRLFHSLFEDHLDQCPEQEKSRLDEAHYQNVCDLGSISSFWVTISMHIPSVTRLALEDSDQSRLTWRLMLWEEKRWPMARRRYQETKSAYETIGRALIKAFEEHRSRETLPRSRAWFKKEKGLQNAVTDFWASIENRVDIELIKPDISQAERNGLLGLVSFGKDPDHLRAVQAEEDAMLAEVEEEKKRNTKSKKKKVAAKPSGKGKEGSSSKTKSEEAEGVERIRSISVSRQNFDEVFSVMFPATEAEKARTFDWKAFVSAMKAVGFQARPFATRLDVLFEHEEYRPILFYKPHPSSTVDAVLCRHYGKRMEKRCQWRRECFVIEDS